MLHEYILPPAEPWLMVCVMAGSKPDVFYLVRLHETGRWTCRCKGFSYRQDCKHVQAVLRASAYTPEMVEALLC